MFANLPLPFSLIALQGLEAPTQAEQVRQAAWGAEAPFEALGTEPLADALPARFETLSYMYRDDEALIFCEAFSFNLVAWQQKAGEYDPFEALDEILPAQHLTVAHFDPTRGQAGLIFADDGVLKRRIYIDDADHQAWVSTGILDEHEQSLWEASDLDGLNSVEELPARLLALKEAQQEDWQDYLQIVLTSLLANHLRFGFSLDLLNPSGAIWAESVASFCLDEDDS